MLQEIEVGKRTPFANWEDFKVAMCVAFAPIIATGRIEEAIEEPPSDWQGEGIHIAFS